MTPIDAGAWAPHLQAGELLLWEGAPVRRARRRWPVVATAVMGFVAGGFALLHLLTPRIDEVLRLRELAIGAGTLLLGWWFLIGQTVWTRYVHARTRYALTNRRALVATEHWGRRLHSHPITDETAIEYRPGDEATIIFARLPVRVRASWRGDLVYKEVGFEDIADGERVMALLHAIQGRAAAARAPS